MEEKRETKVTDVAHLNIGNKFTSKQWTMLVLLALINLGAATVTSLLAPFFPDEAEKKGASPTEYGIIIGVFQFVIFVVSPIYGKYMVQIGPKFLLHAGLYTMSICSILFGLLDKVNRRSVFVGYAFTVRMVQGLGHAGFVTASLALIAKEFPHSVPTTFSLIQTFYGIGIFTGPSLGGALYEIGGYMAPFVCLGTFLFVTAGITLIVMPNYDYQKQDDEKLPQFLKTLKIPTIFVSVMTTFSGASALGFLAATLAPHLRQFDLSPSMNGMMFVIGGLFYSITAPIWGRLCRWVRHTKVLCGIGALLVCLSYTLLGPAPYIPMDTKLWLCIIALCVHGFGIGGELVSSFLGNIREAKAYGYPDTLSTFGLMAAMWTSSTALGGFVGSSVGGALLDHVGFRMGTLFIISQHALLAIINIGYGWHLWKKIDIPQSVDNDANTENSPLILPRDKSQMNGVTTTRNNNYDTN